MKESLELIRESMDYITSIGTKFIENLHENDLYDKTIYFNGDGPYETRDLIDLLPSGITGKDLIALTQTQIMDYRDPQPDYMILGREADMQDIFEYAVELQPNVRFLPQEGFIDLLFGYDWWTSKHVNLLNHYLDHHPPLEYVKQLSDTYTDQTEIEWWPAKETESASSGDSGFTAPEKSLLLDLYNYRIRGENNNKLPESKRLESLSNAYENGVPLKDIVDHINNQIKNRERQHNGAYKYRYAIACWKSDRLWLKREFGKGESWWPN